MPKEELDQLTSLLLQGLAERMAQGSAAHATVPNVAVLALTALAHMAQAPGGAGLSQRTFVTGLLLACCVRRAPGTHMPVTRGRRHPTQPPPRDGGAPQQEGWGARPAPQRRRRVALAPPRLPAWDVPRLSCALACLVKLRARVPAPWAVAALSLLCSSPAAAAPVHRAPLPGPEPKPPAALPAAAAGQGDQGSAGGAGGQQAAALAAATPSPAAVEAPPQRAGGGEAQLGAALLVAVHVCRLHARLVSAHTPVQRRRASQRLRAALTPSSSSSPPAPPSEGHGAPGGGPSSSTRAPSGWARPLWAHAPGVGVPLSRWAVAVAQALRPWRARSAATQSVLGQMHAPLLAALCWALPYLAARCGGAARPGDAPPTQPGSGAGPRSRAQHSGSGGGVASSQQQRARAHLMDLFGAALGVALARGRAGELGASQLSQLLQGLARAGGLARGAGASWERAAVAVLGCPGLEVPGRAPPGALCHALGALGELGVGGSPALARWLVGACGALQGHVQAALARQGGARGDGAGWAAAEEEGGEELEEQLQPATPLTLHHCDVGLAGLRRLQGLWGEAGGEDGERVEEALRRTAALLQRLHAQMSLARRKLRLELTIVSP